MKTLDIVLSVIVIVAGIIILVTKRYEFMIFYVIILGIFSLTTGIRDIRKNENDASAYMRIITFGILFMYFIFLTANGAFR